MKLFQMGGLEGEPKNNPPRFLYDHDSIHEAVAVLNKPAYSIVKGDRTEVFMRKKDFFNAPLQVRLLCTLEESYVLSLERAIIPFNITDPDQQKKAFDTALMKVCTSITSGYFREFSWENYDTVQSMYDREYLRKFDNALHEERIKPFSRPNY